MQEKESIICFSVREEIPSRVNCFGGNSAQPRYHLKQLTLGWNFFSHTKTNDGSL